MLKDNEIAMAVKNVCFKCVIDPFLGGQIQRKGTSTSCSLCASKRKCIPLTEIVTRVEKILQLYIYEGEVDFRWSGNGAEQYQKGESIDIWVSEVFGCDDIEPVVGAVCRELSSYSDDMNYSRLPFRPNDIGHQWGEFQEGMKHGNRFFNESAKAFLDWLFEGLDEYSASSDEHAVVRNLKPENSPPIYRARICITPESVGEITANPARNLAAPPKDKAGEGRMNPTGVPAFYGAFERLTCIAELRPPVGGTVVSGEFRLNREVRLLDFGRFEMADLGPEPSFFDPKYFAKAGRREFLRYLHGEITRPVLPGLERDYLTTQVIAEYLATHRDPRIDGVIFKSVQKESGTNIVLFSHVACAAESMKWRFKGGVGIRGAKSSDAPRIEYVRNSLVYHSIRGVVYDPWDEALAEDMPKVETALMDGDLAMLSG
ncbi:RES family NAD+ phosphorylase [Pseudomonas sp. UBT]|uniref:RES family NAD+ phosphorylase n=1 Tax=Pseudomonas sp. UBT TaxID=3239198 RepID=UPI003D80850D